jgi:AcrR family transcriptional regulator
MAAAGNLTSIPRRTANTKRDTISRLVEVAKMEFTEKGLDGARIDEIARRAGITKQLIYHYYGSKEELFTAIIEETAASAMAEFVVLELDHLPPAEALRAFLYHVFDQYQRYPFLATSVVEENRQHGVHVSARNEFPHLTPLVWSKLGRILDRGVRSGEFRTGLDPSRLLATFTLLMGGCFIHGYCLSVMMHLDLNTAAGKKIWREHAANFILAAVRACDTAPQLQADPQYQVIGENPTREADPPTAVEP